MRIADALPARPVPGRLHHAGTRRPGDRATTSDAAARGAASCFWMTRSSDAHVRSVFRLGASGYWTKHATFDEIVAAVAERSRVNGRSARRSRSI